MIFQLCFWSTTPVCLNVLYTRSAFFEAKSKVSEFKTFVLCTPQYVLRFEVCVDTTLMMKESKAFQNISG